MNSVITLIIDITPTSPSLYIRGQESGKSYFGADSDRLKRCFEGRFFPFFQRPRKTST